MAGKRKQVTNLTLSRASKRFGRELCKQQNRPSLTNLVEHLLTQEHRREFGALQVVQKAVAA